MDKKKKFSLGLLILISLALAGEIIYYNYLKNKIATPEKTANLEITPVPQKLSNLEIAKKVLNCLEGMKDEGGIYFYSKECSSDEVCRSEIEDSRVGLNVLWGKTEYIKKTKDQNQLELLKNDISNYLDNKKISFISPDFWSKNIFFQMKDSLVFSKEEKEMVDGLSRKTKHALTNGSLEILRKIRNQNYTDPDLDLIDLEGPTLEKIDDISREDWRNEVILSFDFLYSFLAEKKQDDLRIAKELLVKATSEYLFLEKKLSLGEKCLLGYVSSQFSNHLENKTLLKKSEDFFRKLKIERSCWFDGSCATDLFEPIVCGLFSHQLYQATEKNEYLLSRDRALNYLIANNFDYVGYQGNYVGDGCFYNKNTDPNKRIRPTLENGLLVGMLSW